jgi:hypothetical protein
VHHDLALARRKVGILKSFSAKHDIIFLQEMHGWIEDLLHLRHLLRRSHELYFCVDIRADAGGVATLIRKRLASDLATTTTSDVIQGRVLFTSWKDHGKEFHSLSDHNFGFTNARRRKIFEVTGDLKTKSANNPENCVVLIGGGVIFLAPGEAYARMRSDNMIARFENRANHIVDARRWQPALLGLTELSQQGFSDSVAWGTRSSVVLIGSIAASLRRCSIRPTSKLAHFGLLRNLTCGRSETACRYRRKSRRGNNRLSIRSLFLGGWPVILRRNSAAKADREELPPVARLEKRKKIAKETSIDALKNTSSMPLDFKATRMQNLTAAA